MKISKKWTIILAVITLVGGFIGALYTVFHQAESPPEVKVPRSGSKPTLSSNRTIISSQSKFAIPDTRHAGLHMDLLEPSDPKLQKYPFDPSMSLADLDELMEQFLDDENISRQEKISYLFAAASSQDEVNLRRYLFDSLSTLYPIEIISEIISALKDDIETRGGLTTSSLLNLLYSITTLDSVLTPEEMTPEFKEYLSEQTSAVESAFAKYLLRADDSEIRKAAWARYASLAPASRWQQLFREHYESETDDSVRQAMLSAAVIAELSDLEGDVASVADALARIEALPPDLRSAARGEIFAQVRAVAELNRLTDSNREYIQSYLNSVEPTIIEPYDYLEWLKTYALVAGREIPLDQLTPDR